MGVRLKILRSNPHQSTVMGADGGSFTHRSEVVKTKAKTETIDKRTQLLLAWFTCALSKRDLEEPIVSDALGRLYNKDAIIEFLLAPAPSAENPISSRPFGQDGWLAAGHLRSLKDVQTLKLTPASVSRDESLASNGSSNAGAEQQWGKAKWECPISMRGMNGSIKFVYVKGCGCVVSEAGLSQVSGGKTASKASSPKEGGASSSSDKENGKSDEESEETKEEQRARCPICEATLATSQVETVTINPVGEEKESMLRAWNEKVAREEAEKAERKAAKKGSGNGKKRKDKDAASDAASSKKAKIAAAATAPSINRKLPTVPDVTKKPVSAAIASLYASRQTEKDKLSPLFSSGYSRVG